MEYCLPEGYRSRHEPQSSLDARDDDGWQPDVYPDAAALARRLGAPRVVGIGCGTGKELAALHPTFDIVGLDSADNIARCRERYEFGTWLELDLENDELLDVAQSRGSVVVCQGMIERLAEPERLLNRLADALDIGAAVVVLATPDRELAGRPEDLGPPDNPSHVREWTSDELRRYLASLGLTGHVGLTRSTELPPCMTSVFAVVPGRAREQREAVEGWWEQRAHWQRLAEEQDRTILRQHTWIGELRSTRDWLAQERQAWETTAITQEAELRTRDERIAELDAALALALGRDGTHDRTSLRWALRLAIPLARVARRTRVRRP